MTDESGPINGYDLLNMKFPKEDNIVRIVGYADLEILLSGDKSPAEEGYHCPVCKYENIVNGYFDLRLGWSFYNGFLYCDVCGCDYPTCLCVPDNAKKAVEIYLAAVEDAIKNHDRT